MYVLYNEGIIIIIKTIWHGITSGMGPHRLGADANQEMRVRAEGGELVLIVEQSSRCLSTTCRGLLRKQPNNYYYLIPPTLLLHPPKRRVSFAGAEQTKQKNKKMVPLTKKNVFATDAPNRFFFLEPTHRRLGDHVGAATLLLYSDYITWHSTNLVLLYSNYSGHSEPTVENSINSRRLRITSA
jgi:hypothetical protein